MQNVRYTIFVFLAKHSRGQLCTLHSLVRWSKSGSLAERLFKRIPNGWSISTWCCSHPSRVDLFSWSRHTHLADGPRSVPIQVVGLATITAACCNTSDDIKTKKWAFVVGVPLLFTTLVYAVTDQSKFQGYFFAERPPPLSNWGGGTFGVINFSELWAPPYHQGLFVVRMFVSITVNICSILLVLIDAVCLEVREASRVCCVLLYLRLHCGVE